MSSLADRLAEASRDRVPPLLDADPTGAAPGSPSAADPRELTARLRDDLLRRFGDRLGTASPDPELEQLVRGALHDALATDDLLLTTSERARITQDIVDDLLGLGPLEPYLRDPELTAVMVNGCERIYVGRDGRLVRVEGRFADEAHLRRTIDRLVGRGGRRVDEASPILDVRLPDGSRVNAVVPPLAVDGSLLTVRTCAAAPYTAADLVAFGTCSQPAADLLAACVRGRLNVVVSGAAGSGTTTTLSALASYAAADERIVTVEETAELQLHHEHVARLEARPPDATGRGAVQVRELLANALRMRPDRVVVGDVRDAAALDVLQAMSSGHDGTLCAVHATGPRDALARLETMALLGGTGLSERALRRQVTAAVDLVVHQSRLRDGSRRITHVTEVRGGDDPTLHDLFVFDDAAPGESGRVRARLRATGLRPGFLERLERAGERLDAGLFATDDR